MTQHTATAAAPLTTGEIARLAGVDRWQMLAAIRRGFLGEPARVGPFRVWTADDLPRVRAALTAAGYLTAPDAPADPHEDTSR